MMGFRLGIGTACSIMLLSGAHAAEVTYDVDFTLPSLYPDYSPKAGTFAVTGSITTDGQLGQLSQYDITGVSLSIGGNKLYPVTFYEGSALLATGGGTLEFDFGAAYGDLTFLTYGYDFDNVVNLYTNNPNLPDSSPNSEAHTLSVRALDLTPQITGLQAFGKADVFTLGTAAVTVPSVPLPASAPMFGAAILALGLLGRGAKREAASEDKRGAA